MQLRLQLRTLLLRKMWSWAAIGKNGRDKRRRSPLKAAFTVFVAKYRGRKGPPMPKTKLLHVAALEETVSLIRSDELEEIPEPVQGGDESEDEDLDEDDGAEEDRSRDDEGVETGDEEDC